MLNVGEFRAASEGDSRVRSRRRGGEASVRAQLILAIGRDGAEFCAMAAPRIRDLSDQWIATTPSDAIALMPGVVRVASLRRGEQAPPLDQMLTSISNSVSR